MTSKQLEGVQGQTALFRKDEAKSTRTALPMRIWAAIPDWLFQLVGFLFFFSYLLIRLPDYFHDFWNMGAYYVFESGYRLSLPWTRVLVDMTCLLIAFSYLFRTPAKKRSSRASEILIGILGGFWPMLPFMLGGILSISNPVLANTFAEFLWRPSLTLFQTLAGASLILIGNGLDVWGYSVLFRSFSIVPEARELKATGPYRLVRHPVYFGQILAQAGVWLFFARISLFSVSFLALFIGLQLYRSKMEDRVLEEAFGDNYRDWKNRTFWFV